MIISNNRSPNLPEFQNLIETATLKLNDDAAKRSSYYLTRNAQLLEDDVKDVLDITAKGTNFEGTIKKISGLRFPDIVAAKYYGVEVKSSKDEKWITLGGSVNESTRVEDVERIFLTFGKLTNPIEFRSRPYEDCLSDVVVTHYPRYKIDMNLPNGKTIFDKMKIPYDALRLSADPVGHIVSYYKSQLKDGESLWWTGKATKDEHIEVDSMKIRLWRTLSTEEKRELMASGFAYFPVLLSNSSTKYEQLSLWLMIQYNVISTSMRDSFSAGGRGEIPTASGRVEKVPRAILNIFENRAAIASYILNTDESILRETWRVKRIDNDRIGQWIDLCTSRNHNSNCCRWLNSIFSRG